MPTIIDNATGQPVEVADHETAVAAMQQGTHGLRADAPVNLLAPDGSIVNADAANVAQLFDAGYRLAGQPEVAKDLERQEFGEGLGNEVAAGVEGAASGATMGLSDIAAKAVAPEYAGELAKRREYNPVAAGIGEGVGVIGSAIASGGTGLIGTAAKALPASLAIRGTEMLAGKLAAKGVQSLGGMAIQGALEGALFGATKVVSDDYLNDHEITAERIAMGAGLGGLTGGLFGAGAHALATGIGKTGELGAQMVDGVMGRLGGRALDGSAVTLPKAVERFGEAATAGRRFDDSLDDAARKITEASSENAHIEDVTMQLSRGGMKKGQLEKLMAAEPPPNMATTVDHVADHLNGIKDALEVMASDAGGYEKAARRSFKNVLTDIEEMTKDFAAPRSTADAAAFFRRMDKLKQRIGSERSALERGGVMGGKDAIDAAGVLSKHYEDTKLLLQDSSLWGGKAAEFQTAINKAINTRLQYARAYDADFAVPYANRVEVSTRDGFVKPAVADPAKIVSALRGAGKFSNSGTEQVLVEGSKRQADMLEELVKHYDVGPEWVAKAAKARQNADTIASEFGKMSTLAKTRDEFSAAMQSTADLPFIGTALVKGAQSIGKGVNMLTGGGRVAMAADQAAVDVARAGAVHTAAVRAADRAERAIEATAAAILKVGRSRAARSIADTATVLGHEYIPGRAGSVRDMAAHLDGVLDEQGDERKKLQSKLWNVRQVSPEMAQAMEGQAIAAARFLRDKAAEASPQPDPSDMFAHLRKPLQNSTSAKRLANYADAVANPEKAIARIKAGEHRREDMETLRAVYPRMAQRLSAAILAKVAETKKMPSQETQQLLSDLTGQPVGRANSPQYTALLQHLIRSAPTAAALQQDRQPRGSNGPSKVASMYAPSSEVNNEQ